MPRRRRRTTDRQPQDQRRLQVRAIRRGSPDPKKLSRAFIGLALARAEADAQAQVEAAKTQQEAGIQGGREADDDGDA